MAATRVQSAGNVVGAVTAITLGSAQGWAAPTAGNLLILVVNATFTTTTPTGWTVAPSVVDDNAAYMWWKIAAGTETSISVTQSGSSTATIFAVEYAAAGLLATPFDVQNQSNTTGTTGTTTAAASITTTGPNGGDLVFTAACLCRDVAGTTMPTGLTWSNGYSAIFNHASAGNLASSDVSTWYAELQQTAAGATSTVATWTNGWNARQALIIGFKLAAAAAPAAPPPGILFIGPTRG